MSTSSKFTVAGEQYDAVVYPAPNRNPLVATASRKRSGRGRLHDAVQVAVAYERDHPNTVVAVDHNDTEFFADAMRASVRANAHVGGSIPWAVLEANQRLAREHYLASAMAREVAANAAREAEASDGRDDLREWLDSLA